MLIKIKNIIKSSQVKYVSKQNKFVFVHIPKCAGSALSHSLIYGLYSTFIRHSPLTAGIDIRTALKISDMLEVDEQKVREVQLASYLNSDNKVFVTGHCYANPSLVSEYLKRWKFLTILRDPVERFVSEYVYNTYKTTNWKNNSLSFEEYLAENVAKESGVTYARFFSGMTYEKIFESPTEAVELSLKNLSNFYKVGLLNNLEQWVSELNKEFNANIKLQRTNVSPNSELSKNILSSGINTKILKELCEVDIEIYNRIKENLK